MRRRHAGLPRDPGAHHPVPERVIADVLLIADVQVEPDAELAGQLVEATQHPGQAHILAVGRHGTESFDWSLDRDYRIEPQDRLLVLATRAGLGRTLARNRPLGTLTR